ncbi:MAG: hypothetical protein LBT97_03010 [Planctomycetota bacterium]|jgi:hypothetical protein|nr:hypothetical protein [Planctomycetota bacterium]
MSKFTVSLDVLRYNNAHPHVVGEYAAWCKRHGRGDGDFVAIEDVVKDGKTDLDHIIWGLMFVPEKELAKARSIISAFSVDCAERALGPDDRRARELLAAVRLAMCATASRVKSQIVDAPLEAAQQAIWDLPYEYDLAENARELSLRTAIRAAENAMMGGFRVSRRQDPRPAWVLARRAVGVEAAARYYAALGDGVIKTFRAVLRETGWRATLHALLVGIAKVPFHLARAADKAADEAADIIVAAAEGMEAEWQRSRLLEYLEGKVALEEEEPVKAQATA